MGRLWFMGYAKGHSGGMLVRSKYSMINQAPPERHVNNKNNKCVNPWAQGGNPEALAGKRCSLTPWRSLAVRQ